MNRNEIIKIGVICDSRRDVDEMMVSHGAKPISSLFFTGSFFGVGFDVRIKDHPTEFDDSFSNRSLVNGKPPSRDQISSLENEKKTYYAIVVFVSTLDKETILSLVNKCMEYSEIVFVVHKSFSTAKTQDIMVLVDFFGRFPNGVYFKEVDRVGTLGFLKCFVQILLKESMIDGVMTKEKTDTFRLSTKRLMAINGER